MPTFVKQKKIKIQLVLFWSNFVLCLPAPTTALHATGTIFLPQHMWESKFFGSPTELPTLEWPNPAMTNPHVPNFKVSNAESDQLYEWPMGTNDLQAQNDQHINDQWLVDQLSFLTNCHLWPTVTSDQPKFKIFSIEICLLKIRRYNFFLLVSLNISLFL
jgi:hypothetical protein